MYDNIPSYRNAYLVPIFELMIGKDSVEVDNEGLILGFFKRSK